jgi:hypothetical protein
MGNIILCNKTASLNIFVHKLKYVPYNLHEFQSNPQSRPFLPFLNVLLGATPYIKRTSVPPLTSVTDDGDSLHSVGN